MGGFEPMTPEEQKAISNLRKAIRAAHKLGIRLAGMDDQLLYATASAFKQGKELAIQDEKRGGSCYSNVAHAVKEIKDDSAGTLDDQCYEDSGGW